MGRYNKSVEAVRWDGTNVAEVRDFVGQGNYEFDNGELAVFSNLHNNWLEVEKYSHVIKTESGIVEICDDYDFQKTYSPVANTGTQVAAEGVITSTMVARNPDKI